MAARRSQNYLQSTPGMMDGAGGFFPAESASISDVMKICSYLLPPPPEPLHLPTAASDWADGGAERWCERVDESCSASQKTWTLKHFCSVEKF